jgi:CBS domain-containing protein
VEIRTLISGSVVSVRPDQPLAEAARRMVDAKVGSALVVTDEGHPGIITERDVLRAVAAGANQDDTPVSEYMTFNAITASPSWSVVEAAKRMSDGGFRHLVVLDDDGGIAGVLSIRDLVDSLLG